MTLGWLLCVVSWNLRWQNIINDDRYRCIEIIVKFYQISLEIQGLLLLMTHNLVLLKGRKWGLAATRCWAGRVKHETSPTTGLGWCKLILGEILDKRHNKLRSADLPSYPHTAPSVASGHHFPVMKWILSESTDKCSSDTWPDLAPGAGWQRVQS